MADLETTQAKLRSTPTGGVSGEHSAYYRRLLSAGYKGYIQGSIGGGALYGSIGLGIGVIFGVPLAIATSGAALFLIPALGMGLGLYGAHTFADIGKTAAIIADSADTNEKRRYLLDRYYETPNDLEAAEIKRQLENANAPSRPDTYFHWRPALIGAAIGIALMAGAVVLMMHGGGPHLMVEAFNIIASSLHVAIAEGGLVSTAAAAGAATETLGLLSAPVLGLVGIAGGIGALAGSLIGIDREFIRAWLDRAEFTVHDVAHSSKDMATREQEVQRLAEAAKRGQALVTHAQEDSVQKIKVDEPIPLNQPNTPSLERHTRPPITPEGLYQRDIPYNRISQVANSNRLVDPTKEIVA